MRRFIVLIVAGAIGLAAWATPTAAEDPWARPFRGWGVPPWFFTPDAPSAATVQGPLHRLYHPPGLPLSSTDSATGTTYCLSRPTGYYFVCGYAAPSWESGEPLTALRPPPPLAPMKEPDLAPSGVLLFRLPSHAEAVLDGEPVGLSGGVGAASVAPGRHRVLIHTGGETTDRTITVASRGILTITPTGITPTEP